MAPNRESLSGFDVSGGRRSSLNPSAVDKSCHSLTAPSLVEVTFPAGGPLGHQPVGPVARAILQYNRPAPKVGDDLLLDPLLDLAELTCGTVVKANHHDRNFVRASV